MSLVLELFFLFGAGILATRLLIRFAHPLHLVDEPNHRSVHREPTPRGGGIAFTVVALLDLLLFHPELFFGHLSEMTALALILGIGILDDRHDAPPRVKFFIIAMATLVLAEKGLVIDEVGRYFGLEIRFGWLAIPFTFFAVAGFTNAMNLVDGIDALAGSLALIVLAAFAWLGWRHGDLFLFRLSIAFMTGVAAFLLFNWRPASIFMGDSGSLTLGFLIAMLSIRALEYLPSVSVLYLGAVPILDTLVAMVRRKRAGYSAMAPDRCHVHHLLLQKNGSVPRAVGVMVAAQGLLLLLGLSLEKGRDQTLPFLFFFLLLYGAYRWTMHRIGSLGIDCYRDGAASLRERGTPSR
jgi:UDP-GlcNAc:undecaprenyl-phosphate GlcNAc-1-phosphate transferase